MTDMDDTQMANSTASSSPTQEGCNTETQKSPSKDTITVDHSLSFISEFISEFVANDFPNNSMRNQSSRSRSKPPIDIGFLYIRKIQSPYLPRQQPN